MCRFRTQCVAVPIWGVCHCWYTLVTVTVVEEGHSSSKNWGGGNMIGNMIFGKVLLLVFIRLGTTKCRSIWLRNAGVVGDPGGVSKSIFEPLSWQLLLTVLHPIWAPRSPDYLTEGFKGVAEREILTWRRFFFFTTTARPPPPPSFLMRYNLITCVTFLWHQSHIM